MIHAYDKIYLAKAQATLGAMLDFAVCNLNKDISDFYQRFLESRICSMFEIGASSVIAGRSGIELALEILHDDTLSSEYRPCMNRSTEYWCGWALAYFQWYTNLSFSRINRLITITEVQAFYSPYHEMDISHFCDRMIELYNIRKGFTNLKRIRLDAGLSQGVLAEIAGIPVRTIQQYEQNQKNINAAKAETVIKLAKALNCDAEDLMEIRIE